MTIYRNRNLAVAGCLAALCLSAPPTAHEAIDPSEVEISRIDQGWSDSPDIAVDGRLADVLENPAFDSFGEHLMPWPGRSYDPSLALADIGSLLPYHSNVRADEVVAALNRMARDVRQGSPIFFPIYSAAAIAADPSKQDTGLFFLRGKPGAAFAIIAPGGGFSYVGSVHEGFPYAQLINAQGLNAFVVQYRVGQGQIAATQDMAAAISYIFDNAGRLDVDTAKYSVWGSSAGARMAALIGSHGVAAFGGDDVPGPAAVVMAYSSHSDIAAHEPPTYVIVGENDGIAPPSAMQRRVDALRRRGDRVQFRLVPDVGHGFGTGLGTPAEGWIDEAVRFWQAVR